MSKALTLCLLGTALVATALLFMPAASAVEPDDDYANATALLPGLNGPFDIEPIGDVDWYVFTVAEPSWVRVETNGTSGDTSMTLYDVNRSYVDYDDDSGIYPWSRIGNFLTDGLYYAVVQDSFGSSNFTGYYVTLEIAPPFALAEGLNGPFNATPVGTQNWFVFDVVEDSYVRLELSNTTDNPYMYLLDSAYSYLDYDDNGGPGLMPRIDVTLSAGTYFAYVASSYSYAVVADYDFFLQRVSVLGADGNGLRTNATVVSLGMNGPFDLDPSLDIDWYQITFPFDGIAEIQTNGSAGYTYLTLYNENGTWLAQDYGSGWSTFSLLQAAVEARNYYMLVQNAYGSGSIYNYTLEIQLYPLPPPDGNDDEASATTLPTGTSGDFSLVTNDEDWYSYTAGVAGTLTAETNGPYGGTYVYIYDVDGMVVSYGYSTGNFSFQMASALVDAGTYLIQVQLIYGFSAVRAYNVTITFDPWVSIDGNDFRSTAQRLTQGINGPWGIEPVSDVDWFFFDAQETGDVQVDLLTAGYYPSLQLYNSTGALIDSGSTVVSYTGNAGRYFVRVSASYYYYTLPWYYLNLTMEDNTDPVVAITTPSNGTQVDNGAVRVNGTTEPGAHVWINGAQILVDENGTFSVLLSVALGTNVYTIVAVDVMGNDEQAVLTVQGIDRNESLTNQLNNANQQLTNTQGQLTNTQQQLAAAQAAQAAAAAQASTTSTQLNQTQSELAVANGSLVAARAEADAQRAIALMGMVLAGVGLAAAVALAVMMVRRRPPQAAPPVQQPPAQAPMTASVPAQPPVG